MHDQHMTLAAERDRACSARQSSSKLTRSRSVLGCSVSPLQTRYFRLFPGRLLYYKDGELMNAESRLGSILLPGASLAIFSGDVHAGHPFCFGVTPPDSDRQYILDADSVAHRNEWIAALMPETKQRLRMGGAESVREGFLVKLGGNVKVRATVTQSECNAQSDPLSTHSMLTFATHLLSSPAVLCRTGSAAT